MTRNKAAKPVSEVPLRKSQSLLSHSTPSSIKKSKTKTDTKANKSVKKSSSEGTIVAKKSDLVVQIQEEPQHTEIVFGEEESLYDMNYEVPPERLKFFSVPIKMFESEDGRKVDLRKAPPLTEEDKQELNRYGSRIMMDKEGHVFGLEVRDDLMTDFKHQDITAEFCQCVEYEYEVSEALTNDVSVRRLFMAKVLLVETLLRLPSIPWLYAQFSFDGLHDFLYQQSILLFFMITVFEGTRLTSIRYSQIGHYEPCKTIITGLTSVGYCLLSSLLTALLQRMEVYFIEYEEHEDPVGILTLNKKLHQNHITYPYILFLNTSYSAAFNVTLSVILLCKKVMNEMGNFFILVLFVLAVGYGSFVYAVVFYSGIISDPSAWDSFQVVFATAFSCKWSMWRFYMLQEVIRGKVMKVNEREYQDVALSFAF